VTLRTLAVLALACTVLAACPRGPRDDQRTGTMTAEDVEQARRDLAPEVRTQLDSGNAAFSAHEFQEARRHYQAAAALDEEAAAAWFGIYMAEMALGNTEAADEAIRRAHEAAPEASLLETDVEHR
jgi:tetratricopeptide (TPR) repeat protein